MRKYATVTAAVAVLLAGFDAKAEEGMWTFNKFPFDSVEKSYGFRPSGAWLDHLRLSSVRLADGCSAAFVSPHGLVQTNHHCVRGCIQDLSTASQDYDANGFNAKNETDELQCPAVEANQLVAIADITERIRNATAGRENEAFAEALKAEKSLIEADCAGKDEMLRCDVVTLYNGGVFNLYTYRRYQEVRLAFAPEASIADRATDRERAPSHCVNKETCYTCIANWRLQNARPSSAARDRAAAGRARQEDRPQQELLRARGDPASDRGH